jgi:RNase P/RNase MRP subunit p29
MALVLADPSTAPTATGYYGGGLGFSGINAIAVCVDTYLDPGYPSGNFVGISNGPVSSSTPDVLNWLSTANVVPSLRATHTFTVKVDDGTLTVSMDGNLLLTQTVNLGPKVLIGFSGGTGSLTDTHAVSGTSILTT